MYIFKSRGLRIVFDKNGYVINALAEIPQFIEWLDITEDLRRVQFGDKTIHARTQTDLEHMFDTARGRFE